MQFADHFSSQAAEYARFRPVYPPELFAWLAAIAPSCALAWDCATGSGQAASALVAHFERVVASDASAAQLAQAAAHPRIEYCVAAAESPPPAARGADLVTVAQALHWFDLGRFYPAVRATLRPAGWWRCGVTGGRRYRPRSMPWWVAITRMSSGRTGRPSAAISRTITATCRSRSPKSRRRVRDERRVDPGRAAWLPRHLVGQPPLSGRPRPAPLEQVERDLRAAWGPVRERTVTWPLFLRAGRVT